MEIRPGWQSTEFLATILTLIASVLVTLFGVPKAEADNLVQAILGAVVAVTSLFSAGLAVWKYIGSRTELKMKSMETDAQIQALRRGL